jgi:hypothetical protein
LRFTDIVGSTDVAARLGDGRWRTLLANRGRHELKGISGSREVFALADD